MQAATIAARSVRENVQLMSDADEGSRPIAVIDLDGVLADVRHRLHHLTGQPRNWEAFFAGISADPVLPEGRAVVDRLAGDHDLVYLTGRPERTRRATEAWLKRHRLPRGELIMRRERDRRPARVTKPSLLRKLAKGRRVSVVVDDDPEVCAALSRDGWPVLVADWMTRAPTLHSAQEESGGT
jgi:phosphoglycolate phosphatase-like HAD superfamily hydrolase